MSLRAFHTSLYQEHCEEIAGLYELRSARLDAWGTTRDDLAELEDRIDAHLDALVLGGDAARDVVAALPVTSDPANLYPRLALAGRAGQFELVAPTLAALAALCGDPDVARDDVAFAARAAADALAHHAPPAWADPLLDALALHLPRVAPALATFVGLARLARGVDALRAILGDPDTDLVPALRAAARLPALDVRLLLARLDHPDPTVAAEAAIAALRRDPRAADAVLQRWPAAWTAIPLALSAGPGFGPHLRARAASDPTPELLVALGLFGDPAAFDVLLAHLHTASLAPAAALGLLLISGAPLRGDPRPDEDADAARLGIDFDVRTDPAAWTQWLKEHRPRLVAGTRRRFGALASPSGDLEHAIAVDVPRWLRRHFLDELVIRHGVDPELEVDAPIAAAARHLAAARPRVQAHAERLRGQPGAWTRHGRPTP